VCCARTCIICAETRRRRAFQREKPYPAGTVNRRCSAEFLEDPQDYEPPKGKVCDVRSPVPDCRVLPYSGACKP
jgi:hypothetical protein